MTVAELKEKLASLPDDMELVSYHEDMEKDGIMPCDYLCEVTKFKKETRTACDLFDYTDYLYDVFVEDEDGDIEAVLM